MMAPPAAAPAAVRRNLFQSQLTRRPPPGKGGVAGGVGMGMGVGMGIGVGVGGAGGVGGGGLGGLDGADDDDTVVVDEEEEQDADEGDGGIVVRDVHGEVELDEPPFLAVEDPDEIVLDSRQENESKWSPSLARRGLCSTPCSGQVSFMADIACVCCRGEATTCRRGEATSEST